MIKKFKSGQKVIEVELPDGARELVGCDADGKEIYVGDWLELVVDGKVYHYRAHLEGFATADNGDRYLCPKQLSKTRVVA